MVLGLVLKDGFVSKFLDAAAEIASFRAKT
jgi:hypothetical protein